MTIAINPLKISSASFEEMLLEVKRKVVVEGEGEFVEEKP